MIQLCQARHPQHSPHSPCILFESRDLVAHFLNNGIFHTIFIGCVIFELIIDVIQSPYFQLKILNLPFVIISNSLNLTLVIFLDLLHVQFSIVILNF